MISNDGKFIVSESTFGKYFMDEAKEFRKNNKREHDVLFKQLRDRVPINHFIKAITIVIALVVAFAATQVGIYYQLSEIKQKLAVIETQIVFYHGNTHPMP